VDKSFPNQVDVSNVESVLSIVQSGLMSAAMPGWEGKSTILIA
jgi:hypothetical protein